jgi:hypothetical protein
LAAPLLGQTRAKCAGSTTEPSLPEIVLMRAASSNAIAGVNGRACASSRPSRSA